MKDDQVFQRQNNDILIVDDSAPNLKFLSEILCADGYLVRQAINGNMALQRLKEKLPAIVLLDVMMPEMDGFEVCRRLKEDETTKFIPVIFISALDDEQSKLQGFMVGGADYITKPFRKDEVLARVKAHINLRNVQLELEAQKNRLINEIEERKITEEKLRESEERFRTTLYGIGDGVITTDNHGLIQLMNSVAEDLTGWTQAEASGKNLEDVFRIINEETRIQVEIPVRKVIREGVVVGLANHTLLISKDGTERPIADSGAPIRNERGEIVGVILVFRDQTEERNAEKALKESEEKYRFLFDNNPLPMWISNMETLAFLNVNEAAIKHYGFSREEFLTMTLKEIRPKKDIPALLTVVSNQTERLNRIGVFKHKKKNGELIDVEIISHQIDYEGSMAMLIVSSDVTEQVKAETDLKESELRFRNIFEHSSVGKSMTGIDGTLQVNRAFIEMLGYNEEELKGKNWTEVSHPDDLQKTNQLIDDLLEGKIQKARFEKRYIHKKGNVVWADVSTFLQRDHEGIPQYFITSINNITQRKLDEEKINQQNNRLNAIIEAMPDLIFVSDREGHYLEFFNPKALELLYPSEHLVGVSVRDVFDAPTAELHIRKINECLEQKRLTNYEYYGMKDGVQTFYEARIVYLEEDRVLRFVRDITERKNAELAFLEANQKMDSFFNHSLDGFFFMMLDEPIEWNEKADKEQLLEYVFLHQRITRINEAMLDQYGATSDQFIGMTPKDMFGHNIEHGKNEWRKLFDQGKLHTETDERKLNGEQIFIEGDYICQYDSKGRITGHFGIQRDVTQNKMAVDAIKNERKLLRTLIDNLPVTIYVKDQGTRKIVANALDLEVMGILDEADVLGKTDLELFGNEIGQRGYADDLKVIQTGQSVINREEVFLDKDGFQRWLLTSKIPLFDHQGNPTGLVGIGRDITEMKKAENQIKKLTKSIEQSPSSIVITDIQGNIEYVNPMFSEISGYSKDEVIGKNPRILKSGEMPAEVYSQMWNTIKAGEVWRGEFLNRKKNGELYWEWATMTSIKNEDGEITNYLSIKEDISLRKQMEADLIIAKNKAEESDHLKSAFLANMSHEIRTPLNSIIGFSELLSDSDFEIDEKKEFIQHIISNGNSLLNIISDIMDISRMESGQVTIRESQIHVNKFITRIKEQFSIKFAETNVEFKLEIPNSKEKIFILADTDRLSQIFTNLISNALKFTTQGFIQIGYQVKGDMVEFCVTDTGIGIPADFHDKIFDRFRQVESSNTRKYGGNGLGLAITRNLVELMGGKIWIESESGKGSSFYFVLPLFSGN